MMPPNIFTSEMRVVEAPAPNELGEALELEMDDHTIALIYPHERMDGFAKLFAASKSLAACLHKQMERLRTMPNWEFITRPTKLEMVEEMRQELLKAGYTE